MKRLARFTLAICIIGLVWCAAWGTLYARDQRWGFAAFHASLIALNGWNLRREWKRGYWRSEERDSGGTDSGTSTHAYNTIGANVTLTGNPGTIGEPGEGVDPELVVPDASEAIVGYREWNTEMGMGVLLGHAGTKWPKGKKITAKHARDLNDMYMLVATSTFGGSYPERKKCKAPAMGCSCGVYAYSKPKEFSGVFGEVNLWGRVLQGKRGWRAEFAYPKRLWVSQPSYKPVQNALDALEEVPDAVREQVQEKLEETKTWYAEEYLRTRYTAEQLRANYGIPVELHDPDQPHPFSPELAMEKTEAQVKA